MFVCMYVCIHSFFRRTCTRQAKDNDLKVIECNLRSSRTFPFISKMFDFNFIALATKASLAHQCRCRVLSLPSRAGICVCRPLR